MALSGGLPLLSSDWRGSRLFYALPWDQYQRLEEAMVLDIDAALKSASWGKFQILGEYHSGWPNVRGFANAMYESELNHLLAFEAYCNSRGLFGALKRKDWFSFAVYNGTGKQAEYAELLRRAYIANGGRR